MDDYDGFWVRGSGCGINNWLNTGNGFGGGEGNYASGTGVGGGWHDGNGAGGAFWVADALDLGGYPCSAYEFREDI